MFDKYNFTAPIGDTVQCFYINLADTALDKTSSSPFANCTSLAVAYGCTPLVVRLRAGVKCEVVKCEVPVRGKL